MSKKVPERVASLISSATKSPLLPQIIIGLYLCAYLTAGLCTELKLAQLKPIPQLLLEDFGYYERALSDALNRRDPYAIRTVGTGYLYPPPALLIVEMFSHIKPFLLKVSVYSVTNIVFLLLTVYGVATYYGYSLEKIWYWFVLSLGFAPFLELLHVGQINLITLFGIFLLFFKETSFPVLSGVGLSLAIVTKATPLLFLGYLAANKRFKVVATTIVATVMIVCLGILRYGVSPFMTYPDVFRKLLGAFPLGAGSQSLIAKLAIADSLESRTILSSLPVVLQSPIAAAFAFFTNNYTVVHRALTLYILLAIGISATLTFFGKQPKEPLFIMTSLGMMLASNVMWYHHYVFFLLPLLVWMGWSRLRTPVVVWCFVGLLIIQIDRWSPPYGLLIHVFGHLSLLSVLSWQVYRFSQQKHRLTT